MADTKKWFMILLGIFMLSAFAGYYSSIIFRDLAEKSVENLFSEFSFVSNLEHYEIALFIFFNNALKSFVAMVLGLFFGIVPILFILFNGFVVGVVAGYFSSEAGIFSILLLLIPHGILEIPAVLLSCAYGVELGIGFYRTLKGKKLDLREEMYDKIKKFGRNVVPILAIAAVVETYVTPLIASL